MKKFLQTIKLDFVNITVLVSYYLLVAFLFLGLAGIFSRLTVSFVLFVLLLAIFFLRKYIIFHRKYLWFFLLVPIITAGFGFLRGFFSGDAYQLWLPVAKHISQTGHFPGFEINYFFSRMPLLSLLFAGTFSFFNSFKEVICIWIPFFFSTATLILIYQWAKDKNLEKKFLFFIPVLFLTNIIVEFYGSWNLLQESIVLFFATAFFYYYEKYLTDSRKKNLIFLILSFVLVCASKISGLFLFIIILFLFYKTKDKKRLFSYLFFFSVPMIFWLVRNYLVFDNPVYPILNSFFQGRYYQADQLYNLRYLTLDILPNLWNRYIWVIKEYLWIFFPFIILSFYGFIKKRRYDYLFLIGSFFLIKEAFLFTPNDSSARYFYIFFGLFLVYALIGLEQLKSRWMITILVVLAFAGLLIIPVTNSSSQFISVFENKLNLFKNLFDYLYNYWYLVLIILIPFVYRASSKEGIKMFLIFLYSFFILHLRFVANKSWINTWTFIFLAILLFLWFALRRKRIKYFKQILIIAIIFLILVNSWGMALIYNLRHGISIPVDHLWQESKWAESQLDKLKNTKEDFYILIFAQTGYFAWFTDYQTITLFNREFWYELKDYSPDMTDQELQSYLKDNRVKYIVKNETDFGYYPEYHEKFLEKIEDNDQFLLLSDQQEKYFLWQVYEN